jgi:hypothetical protein
MKKMVEDFCSHFDGKCFKKDLSYWFAYILKVRFSNHDAVIVYDIGKNQFGCKIENEVYNINGQITKSGNWVVWLDYADKNPEQASNIYRNFILKY